VLVGKEFATKAAAAFNRKLLYLNTLSKGGWNCTTIYGFGDRRSTIELRQYYSG